MTHRPATIAAAPTEGSTGSVAHEGALTSFDRQELRQCIRTISLYAQLLERPDADREGVGEDEAVQYIQEAVRRMEQLMGRTLLVP